MAEGAYVFIADRSQVNLDEAVKDIGRNMLLACKATASYSRICTVDAGLPQLTTRRKTTARWRTAMTISETKVIRKIQIILRHF